MKKDKSVAIAVINSQNKVLIMQRRSDVGHNPSQYECPGGKLEPSESFEDAARRELEEEAGIKIEEYQLELTYSNDHYHKGKDTMYDFKLFITRVDGAVVRVESRTFSGFAWAGKEEIADLEIADYCVKSLKAIDFM